MPHGGYHGPTKGLGQSSNKPDTSAYKQAAQSMKSAGIKSLSGATTSDDKGKKARKIQEQFRNKSSNNNQSDPIVPKKKPPPDKEKKDIQIIAPGKDPDRDDRPKSKGIMKSETKSPNVFGLEYNMNLNLPSTVDSFGTFATTTTDSQPTNFADDLILAAGKEDLVNAIENPNIKNAIKVGQNIATKVILQDNGFQQSTTNFINENVPEIVKDTIGASYIIANAAITGDLNLKRKLTDNIEVEANVEDYGKNMRLFIGYSTEF